MQTIENIIRLGKKQFIFFLSHGELCYDKFYLKKKNYILTLTKNNNLCLRKFCEKINSKYRIDKNANSLNDVDTLNVLKDRHFQPHIKTNIFIFAKSTKL